MTPRASNSCYLKKTIGYNGGKVATEEKWGGRGKKNGGEKKKRLMEIVATTSLPAVGGVCCKEARVDITFKPR